MMRGGIMNKKAILIIDSDREVAAIFKSFFGTLGYDTSVATDEGDAMNMIDNVPFDLLLLDIEDRMFMKGLDILKYVRSKKPEAKIIAITKFDHETKEKADKIGIDDFFDKPVVMTDLLKSIQRFIGDPQDVAV